MPARKKKVHARKKAAHIQNRPFLLKPKQPVLALLELIDLKLLTGKSRIVARALLPKGPRCFATFPTFSPPCKAARFFDRGMKTRTR